VMGKTISSSIAFAINPQFVSRTSGDRLN